MRQLNVKYWAICIFILVLVCDQLSKSWIHNYIPHMLLSSPYYPYGGIGIFEDWGGIQLSITHATNTGAAWGIFNQFPLILVLVRLFVVTCLVIYFLQSKLSELWLIPGALVLAGALGNIIDYFNFGHVVDMFYFRFWGYSYPVFNVADSSIFIGIVLLFFVYWRQVGRETE